MGRRFPYAYEQLERGGGGINDGWNIAFIGNGSGFPYGYDERGGGGGGGTGVTYDDARGVPFMESGVPYGCEERGGGGGGRRDGATGAGFMEIELRLGQGQ